MKDCDNKQEQTAEEKAKQFAEFWKNPKLINVEQLDKIPKDLIERILKL